MPRFPLFARPIARWFKWAWTCGLTLVIALPVRAAQLDIQGPSGSSAFGTSVTVLPNGNFVVTDPYGPVSNVGAVYLYSPSGALISTLTGSSANDHVGDGGVTVVGGGHFVVNSPFWHNGAATQAGAVTWINGDTGLSGVVSASNSLVGTTDNDRVGRYRVIVLNNGNYVVASPEWNNGVANAHFGAATWGNGSTGITGPVSAGNSLIGTTAKDQVGNEVTALSNGNYVVSSPYWHNGGAGSNFGAATWGNGSTGITGPVSASNSLVGTTTDDYVSLGGVSALSNGNYVVKSSYWNNGVAGSKFGAATWGNGTTGITGPVSASNSLVGTTANDQVGYAGVTALRNGNYVILSPFWNNGAITSAGAVTWSDGSAGITGPVSAGNSLVGTTADDYVGYFGVTALSNGNYVVVSPNWNNGVANGYFGAATWGNGTTGIAGPVTVSNSLVGSTANDQVGSRVIALSNGNYVVASLYWNNGVANGNFGAATWGDGSSGVTGPVSASNSLVGTTGLDQVGGGGVTALSNGNYVVESTYWNNGVAGGRFGAATWGNGSMGSTGPVSVSNSLIGTTANDYVGYPSVTALRNGNYVVASRYWNNGMANSNFGAVTWANGSNGIAAALSDSNSLVGTTANDAVGYGGVTALSDGNYVVASPHWNNGAATQAGAVTLASGGFRLKGTIQPWNSVLGAAANGGPRMSFTYDPVRQALIVGRPADNIVSVFTMDQIFADDFEP